MIDRKYPVRGTADVMNVLFQLGQKIETNAIRSGLSASAAVLRKEMKLRVPKKTGRLARAIKSGSPRKNADGTFSVRVYVDESKRGGGFYGYFLEYGVRPHFIRSGDANWGGNKLSPRILTKAASTGGVTGDRETKALKINGAFISGEVFHPGITRHPFFIPAIDTKAGEAVDAFRDKIIAVIEKKTGFDAGATFREAA